MVLQIEIQHNFNQMTIISIYKKKQKKLVCHTNIKNQCMNLNNGDMFHTAMHSGCIIQNSSRAPRMHCGMKHVTIVEIHTLILDVCMCLSVQ